MRYAIMAVMLLGGVGLMAFGAAWCIAVVVARRVFERALASAFADTVRVQASDLIEKIRNPLVRRIVNQRTGAFAGNLLIDKVRDDLQWRLVLGVGIMAAGAAGFVAAFFAPWW